MDEYFRRGTKAYDEAVRILGNQAGQVLDESVRQISNRWLKATFFEIVDYNIDPILNENGTYTVEVAPIFILKNRRVRIPKGSYLTKKAP